ncbi:MAG TPA: phosphohistidine phosphatase SixA [Blastocatellia bacterium]|nr:phosphohistidine phosphatase SixA [Blastocatellia bacterium]
MELYLVQHGEARSEAEDPERSLTERGQKDVERIAAWASRAGLRVSQIRHSGKRRAEQTATILANYLKPPAGTIVMTGLAPHDDVFPLATALRQETEPLMLVGHLPFLSRLASLLLVGEPDRPLVRFRMGGIVCLEREHDQWSLAWIVPPDLVP